MILENSQLKIIVAVYSQQNFSDAARKLHVTQSAISQSLKNIEQKLDLKIFHRVGNKMIPTKDGKKIIDFGQKYFINYDKLVLDLQQNKHEVCGSVEIGTVFGLGKTWVSRTCIQLSKEYSDLNLTIKMGLVNSITDDFLNGVLDFLIVPSNKMVSEWKHKISLGEESLVFVYPKNDKFNISNDIKLLELEEIPTILFEKYNDGLFNLWCKKTYKKLPKKINKKFIINSHGNILQAVSEGLGIAVVPEHVFLRSFYKDKVNFLKNKIVTSSKVFLVYHPEDLSLLRFKIVKDELAKRSFYYEDK